MQIDNTPSPDVGTRLLFENERIRVWDLALAPGESLATHVHKLPFCFIVVTPGHLRHQNPNDPSDAHENHFEKDLVVFLDPSYFGRRDGAPETFQHRCAAVSELRHRVQRRACKYLRALRITCKYLPAQ